MNESIITESILMDFTTTKDECGVARHCAKGSFEYFAYVFMHTPIAFLGIFFNIINIIVFSFGRKRFVAWGSLYVFLLGLSVTDLLCMTIVAPYGLIFCLCEDKYYFANVYIFYIFIPLANFFATCSVWLTMTMTIDRYIPIKIPSWRKQYRKKRAKITITVIIFASAILNAPFYFSMRVQSDGDFMLTEFGTSKGFAIYNYIRAVLAKYLPILIVIIANTAMGIFLFKRKVKRRVSVNVAGKINPKISERNIHMKCIAMLFCTSSIMVFCHCLEPLAQYPVAMAITQDPCITYNDLYRALVSFITTLETLSYASNFIFYFMCNTVVRKTCLDILKCRL